MKRLVSLVLLVALFSVQANAASSNSLKDVFKTFSTELSRWNQKDKAKYAEITKNFQDDIAELQKSGLSNAELLNFAKSEVKDENVRKELETALTLIQVNMLSEKEARKLIINTLEKSTTEGANWSSSGTIVIASVLLVVVVAAVIAGGGTVSVGSGGYGCYDEYVCYDYYDSWGYYWYTDCWYETYCY